MAFLGGISGQIYKQFALTIAASVLISAFNALSLSPALSAILLRPKMQTRGPLGRFFNGFDRAFEWTSRPLPAGRERTHPQIGAGHAGPVLLLVRCSLFRQLPTSFLPDEDQGTIYVTVRLPDAASAERANMATRTVEDIVSRIPGVAGTFTLGGTDISTRTSSSNVATVITRLKPWDERTATDQQFRRHNHQHTAGRRACRKPAPTPSASLPYRD